MQWVLLLPNIESNKESNKKSIIVPKLLCKAICENLTTKKQSFSKHIIKNLSYKNQGVARKVKDKIIDIANSPSSEDNYSFYSWVDILLP